MKLQFQPISNQSGPLEILVLCFHVSNKRVKNGISIKCNLPNLHELNDFIQTAFPVRNAFSNISNESMKIENREVLR